MAEEIGLSEFIGKIKADLENAQQDSKVFLIDKVELEIQVTASRKGALDGEAKGKLDINVVPALPFNLGKIGEVEAGGKLSGELSRQDIHTVKVSLTPAAFNEAFMKMLSSEQKEELQKNTKKLTWMGGDTSRKGDFQ